VLPAAAATSLLAMSTAAAGGQHADVHHQRLCAECLHAFAQEGDLVALGVGGADQHQLGVTWPPHSSNARLGERVQLRQEVSSSSVMTSGGDRIMLGPEMRTISPRR
jgi:hypothetical protein